MLIKVANNTNQNWSKDSQYWVGFREYCQRWGK